MEGISIDTATKRQGMAITSMVLGILSILVCGFGILPGIPAIITGHVARSRARTQPDQHAGTGFALAGIITGYIGTALSILGLLLWLPAMSAAKQKAQSISCLGNMKLIALSFRIWASDHQERFPFNVSTNEGGTLEFCALGNDGFDPNAALHFQVLSNELSTPRILVCPADSSKRPAIDFRKLRPANVSYLLRSGTNIHTANPRKSSLDVRFTVTSVTAMDISRGPSKGEMCWSTSTHYVDYLMLTPRPGKWSRLKFK